MFIIENCVLIVTEKSIVKYMNISSMFQTSYRKLQCDACPGGSNSESVFALRDSSRELQPAIWCLFDARCALHALQSLARSWRPALPGAHCPTKVHEESHHSRWPPNHTSRLAATRTIGLNHLEKRNICIA